MPEKTPSKVPISQCQTWTSSPWPPLTGPRLPNHSEPKLTWCHSCANNRMSDRRRQASPGFWDPYVLESFNRITVFVYQGQMLWHILTLAPSSAGWIFSQPWLRITCHFEKVWERPQHQEGQLLQDHLVQEPFFHFNTLYEYKCDTKSFVRMNYFCRLLRLVQISRGDNWFFSSS